MKIFKPSTLVSLGIAIAAALLTQPVRATAIDTIVFTENSSSSLTVIFNGTDITATGVNNTSADHWTITLPQAIGDFGVAAWNEPENAPIIILFDRVGFNQVTWDSSTQLSFVSDTSDSATTLTLNGQTAAFANLGLSMQVTDVSDAAATPDTGTTLGLLSLSVVALLGATRLRFLQLAA